MQIYFAPLEGVTDAIFRRTHHECFHGVSHYYIPFISPTQNLVLTGRELNAVSPAANEGIPVVPQVLTKEAEHFLWAAQTFADFGYTGINLNAGCPSGTVTAKGKGGGLLRSPDTLDRLLDHVCSASPLPISVKTRIGFYSEDEWPALLDIYNRYPIRELIIHPRTVQQQYSGTVYTDAFRYAVENARMPLVYNGDLFSTADCLSFREQHGDQLPIMLGRGLIANPALAQELCGGEKISIDALRHFHNCLLHAYCDRYQQSIVVNKMRIIANYLSCCLEDTHKALKAMRKAKTLPAYKEAASMLFEGCPLAEKPMFHQN